MKNQNPKLTPCYLCGDLPVFIKQGRFGLSAECLSCGANTDDHMSPHGAIEEWNEMQKKRRDP